MSDYIEHPGVVKEIKDQKILIVSILSTSACSQCHSKVACTMNLSEIKEKEIEVEANPLEYPVGTKVIVQMKIGTGGYAIFLSYILPLIIVMTTIFLFYKLYNNEGIAGLLGLLILVPYYTILYFVNNKIKERIKFTVKKCS